MQTASCWLKLNQFGSNVQLHGVTPAEVQFLCQEHGKNAGGAAIASVFVTDEVKRSSSDERTRLISKYGEKKVNALFTGATAALPETFDLIKMKVENPPAAKPAPVTPAKA